MIMDGRNDKLSNRTASEKHFQEITTVIKIIITVIISKQIVYRR